jgi:DNA-binding winged helix-turn-helix (wHTH) protein/DNA-binding CsgD family transcriptional regulator
MEETCKFAFGPFVLDSIARVLLKSGVQVPLYPKALDVLVILVSAAGGVVSRSQLLDRVWPTTCVEQANIDNDIALLRRALEGEPASRGPDRYIVTVPRKGYRFAAPVTTITEADSSCDDGSKPIEKEPEKMEPTGDRGITKGSPIGVHEIIISRMPARNRGGDNGIHHSAAAMDRPAPSPEEPLWNSLTQTEMRVLQLIAAKRTSREIADHLHIATRTVETYRARISGKLGLRGSYALLKFALERRLEILKNQG